MHSYNSKEKVCEIVKRRLCGEPVTSIANDIGVSRQYIYMVLSKFPKHTSKSGIRQSMPIEEEYDIIMEYMDMLPQAAAIDKYGLNNCAREVVSIIAHNRGLTIDDVYNVLYHMTDLHPTIKMSPYYTKLENWRVRNSISLKSLSDMTGIPTQRLREILRGWQHLPLAAAAKIAAHSGLTVEDIYSDIIALEQAGGESNA